jgi:hypothetical protein
LSYKRDEENYIKIHHNQMTENQWQRENSKLAEAKRHVMYRETKRER